MSARCTSVSDAPDMAICFAIRTEVFIREQSVPLEEEFDDNDATSMHFLLRTEDGQPAGTARLRYVEGKVKIERVAIRKSQRGKGLGRLLIETMLAHIRKEAKAIKVTLGSQTQAIPFYETFGFKVVGDEYMDANIPHKDMELNLINA